MTLFADGEPLDVDKLNKLAQDVQKMQGQLSLLTTRYDENNKRVVNVVPIIVTNSVSMSLNKGITSNTINIPGNAFLGVDKNPSIHVTISNSKSSGVVFSVNNVTRSNFNIKLYSDITQDIVINWTAIALKTTS
jgi:hypothetical protein